ncbi:MAG TPA: hypothetical protein VHS31_07355 [Tepidisphaeraceae bacterium]|jgi:phage FluMu protein Com|nr:hypothetical protein [Tepidisphaeraceae bacterium]
MPISISCTRCGKALKIKDEYIGKRIKCPQCSTTFTTGEAQAKEETQKRTSEASSKLPMLHLGTSAKVFLACLILISSSFAGWKLGPGRILNHWAEIEPKARDNVSDVINRAMQSYSSHLIFAGVGLGFNTPQVQRMSFMLSPMPLSTPDWVGFVGATSVGNFHGRYYLATGEVEADADFVVGVVTRGGARGHETRTFHVTGRMKDNDLTVEVDGKPATATLRHAKAE